VFVEPRSLHMHGCASVEAPRPANDVVVAAPWPKEAAG
jgi:hypothetical protein